MEAVLSLVQLALHHALHILCNSAGCHFEGLAVASRHLKKQLSFSQQRRLQNLDIAYNLTQHITRPLMKALLKEVETAVSVVGAADVVLSNCSLDPCMAYGSSNFDLAK